MAKYDNSFTDELRQRLSLVDVISRRVPLKKKGQNYWGCCPFHNEKTPSFSVNEEKGFYHCFGCGEHGDIISFTMKSENIDFVSAIKELADMAGIKMPDITSWLQSPSAEILEPPKIKSNTVSTVSTVSPSICHEVMGPDAMIFVF